MEKCMLSTTSAEDTQESLYSSRKMTCIEFSSAVRELQTHVALTGNIGNGASGSKNPIKKTAAPNMNRVKYET